jgi:magnesium chelatase subunit D
VISVDDREVSPRWADAACAAALLAVDPAGLGGVVLRAGAGPVRDRWLAGLQRALPVLDTPLRRMPLHITDGRLLGGLDLAATLRAGWPVAERGLLADCDGGLLLVPMTERLTAALAARIAAVLDDGELRVERDGLALSLTTRFGVIAFDESEGDDAPPPAALLDRLAMRVDLTAVAFGESSPLEIDGAAIAAARARLPGVDVPAQCHAQICALTLALGIDSLRAALLALRVARAHAAWQGRDVVGEPDLAVAGRLVLAARATQLPSMDAATDNDDVSRSDPPTAQDGEANETAPPPPADPHAPLDDRVLAATRAAIPPGLLALLQAGLAPRRATGAGGRAGASRSGQRRGRPTGARRGELRAGARLSVVETLRAAAPWQPLRRAERHRHGSEAAPATAADAQHARRGRARVEVRRDDLRIARFKQRTQTSTLFAVDASGSSALHRLAEAKGAVELLLADCYVRRDEVALIAFRGQRADLLLPPTRSLVRAKRSLAGLPGGGATPLAAGLEALLDLAQAELRRGHTPVAVVLTDGRANMARDGTAGRAAGDSDALAMARQLRAAGLQAVLIDTSPRPQPAAALLADTMGARYLPLPHADAQRMAAAVQTALPPH